MQSDIPEVPSAYLYRVKEYGSWGWKGIKEEAENEGRIWGEADWNNRIQRRPQELLKLVDEQFQRLEDTCGGKEYFTDDREECKRLYEANFVYEYQKVRNDKDARYPFWHENHRAAIEKAEHGRGLHRYTVSLSDFHYMKIDVRLSITFNEEGEIIDVIKAD